VFTHTTTSPNEATEWMTYHHLLRTSHVRQMPEQLRAPANLIRGGAPGTDTDTVQEALIANMQGYNTSNGQEITGRHWVGDLMLDCEVQITDPQGEFVLELSKGIDRFQARFDVASGKCKLVRRTGNVEEKMTETVLAEKETKLKQKGNYHVRFANFDEQLTVWVDRQLPFGNGVAYSPAKELGPVPENDILAPARVGAKGGTMSVSHLQLWRDTYYTLNEDQHTSVRPVSIGDNRDQKFQSFYVQPGHYLALGDNSSASSDSRYWGLVPQRLLLGRALWVYYPFGRFGGIE
jgi:signal peptidase I